MHSVRVTALIFTAAVLLWSATGAAQLVNPGFEETDPTGRPSGWTVLWGLDRANYGPPDYGFTFDAVRPVSVSPGRGGRGRALGFPVSGVWRCEVGHHSKGRIGGEEVSEPGFRRGKAAAYQVVTLPPGAYRFGAYLRTADGDYWSGSFSLGVAVNGTTQYAHDSSTGVAWTDPGLAMRNDPNGDYTTWGEWQWRETAPFRLEEESPVSVWVRFNYANEHATNVRWEVDDAAIVPVSEKEFAPRIILDGRWRDLAPPAVRQIGSFRMEIEAVPIADWRELTIRFRENEKENEGYVLELDRGGRATLRSLRDGPIAESRPRFPETEFRVRLVIRGQYLRVDLPGQAGFETSIIGSATGACSFGVDPPGSLDISARIVTMPDSEPEIPVPVAGEFEKVYDPSTGEDGPWYINDHCVLRDATGTWHMFGITHAEPFNPPDEDFFAHATASDLMQVPWEKRPPVCRVNEAAGETHVWAPHVVLKDGLYYMFYCGGGANSDEYRIDLRTSRDLEHWDWYDGNPLFTDIGDARDPMVFGPMDGKYLMYYTRPSDLDEKWSGVAVRESEDLLHWSEPTLALVSHEKNRFGRLTESPFVFRYEDGEDSSYYLSSTGLGGGYRNTTVWRSVDPRSFDPDHVFGKLDAHAPEWISTGGPVPSHVTHCGWKQGGFFIAPVEWVRRPWPRLGLLVVRGAAKPGAEPIRVTVSRANDDRAPYRVSKLRESTGTQVLPPGRYRVTVDQGGESSRPFDIEIVEGEQTAIELAP